jgi:hypothetical protein
MYYIKEIFRRCLVGKLLSSRSCERMRKTARAAQKDHLSRPGSLWPASGSPVRSGPFLGNSPPRSVIPSLVWNFRKSAFSYGFSWKVTVFHGRVILERKFTSRMRFSWGMTVRTIFQALLPCQPRSRIEVLRREEPLKRAFISLLRLRLVVSISPFFFTDGTLIFVLMLHRSSQPPRALEDLGTTAAGVGADTATGHLSDKLALIVGPRQFGRARLARTVAAGDRGCTARAATCLLDFSSG